MVSQIKAQMKFDMNYADFFTKGSTATLTNSVASFLGISADRIRIVSVRAGSAIVDISILPDPTKSASATVDSTTADLNKIKAALDTGMSGGSLNLASIAPVLDYTSTVHVVVPVVPVIPTSGEP